MIGGCKICNENVQMTSLSNDACRRLWVGQICGIRDDFSAGLAKGFHALWAHVVICLGDKDPFPA